MDKNGGLITPANRAWFFQHVLGALLAMTFFAILCWLVGILLLPPAVKRIEEEQKVILVDIGNLKNAEGAWVEAAANATQSVSRLETQTEMFEISFRKFEASIQAEVSTMGRLMTRLEEGLKGFGRLSEQMTGVEKSLGDLKVVAARLEERVGQLGNIASGSDFGPKLTMPLSLSLEHVTEQGDKEWLIQVELPIDTDGLGELVGTDVIWWPQEWAGVSLVAPERKGQHVLFRLMGELDAVDEFFGRGGKVQVAFVFDIDQGAF